MSGLRFRQLAYSYGCQDIQFVNTSPFSRWEQASQARATGIPKPDLVSDPLAILPEATAVAVLFFSCPPYEDDTLPPHYYMISQRAYHATKAITQAWRKQGEQAICHAPLPARAAALRAGGTIGLNGLYIHPTLGSFVHIQTVLLTGVAPDPDGETLSCDTCTACRDACPVQAIDYAGINASKCLRFYLFSPSMPNQFRQHVRAPLGCECCQRVCPHNQSISPIQEDPCVRYAFSPHTLLNGVCKPASALIGPNYARKKHLIPQTLLVIGARQLVEYRDNVSTLVRQGIPYADWAFARLDEASKF